MLILYIGVLQPCHCPLQTACVKLSWKWKWRVVFERTLLLEEPDFQAEIFLVCLCLKFLAFFFFFQIHWQEYTPNTHKRTREITGSGQMSRTHTHTRWLKRDSNVARVVFKMYVCMCVHVCTYMCISLVLYYCCAYLEEIWENIFEHGCFTGFYLLNNSLGFFSGKISNYSRQKGSQGRVFTARRGYEISSLQVLYEVKPCHSTPPSLLQTIHLISLFFGIFCFPLNVSVCWREKIFLVVSLEASCSMPPPAGRNQACC